MGWFARYRHSKGFGIHSPFAFRFVTEVIGERLPYYDYAVIPDRQQRLLYRMACFFKPRTVTGYERADISAVLMACPHVIEGDNRRGEDAPHSQSSEMVVTRPGIDPERLRSAIRRRAVVVVIGKHRQELETARQALLAMGCGMTFDNQRDMAIIVPWQRLPRQDFNVRF